MKKCYKEVVFEITYFVNKEVLLVSSYEDPYEGNGSKDIFSGD